MTKSRTGQPTHELKQPELAKLRDGRPIVVRRIRPDDAPRLIEGFQRLSPRSVRLRFFSPLRELDPRFAQRLANVDFVTRAAYVVTFPDEDDILAVGRYEGMTNATAELAFVVADDLQGQGIATHLLQHLVALGRANGLERFTAMVLPENPDMLDVFRGSGLPMRVTHGGEAYRVELRLNEAE